MKTKKTFLFADKIQQNIHCTNLLGKTLSIAFAIFFIKRPFIDCAKQKNEKSLANAPADWGHLSFTSNLIWRTISMA